MRITGAVLLTAFLILTLVIAIEGAAQTRMQLAATFASQAQIQQAQISLEELLRLQIDEENMLRGYSLTQDPFYVRQYHAAASGYDMKESAIRRTLIEQNLTAVQNLLTSYAKLQAQWRTAVAAPLLVHPTKRLAELDKRNKLFSDYENRLVAAIRVALARDNDLLGRSTQQQLDQTAKMRELWILIFGVLAIVLNAYRSQLNRELVQERTTTEILQQAFRSEAVPLPHCEVGTVYRSATSHSAVGGDVFDVYRLTDRTALLFIADISGKGVDAAVLTAFIKFMIRSIALRQSDPGRLLDEFNTAFARAVGNPDMFVSMFVGLLDTETFRLEYASGGHDSAFLRRDHAATQLAVTGPVLGVMEEPFGTEVIDLEPGDMLVLATDGLTEARDRKGRPLQEGVLDLIAESGPGAQELADQLVERVRKRGGNQLHDDLAILAILVLELGSPRE